MPDLFRAGRIGLVPPEAMAGGIGEARAYGARLLEGEWPPLPDGPAAERRAARRADREAAWEAWWHGEQASSVGFRRAPERFDRAALSDEDRVRLAVLRERRQLGEADPDGDVLDPAPGARWARAATYFPDPRYDPPFVDGRVLLDAGPSLFWAEGSRRTGEDEALLEGLGALAAAYRAGPAPGDAFALRRGALVGPPLRPRWIGTTEKVGVRGREAVRVRFASEYLGLGGGQVYEGPFAELSVRTEEEETDPPTQADFTFEQGLAVANAQLAGTGAYFRAVDESRREAGGRTGHEMVALSREGWRLRMSYKWEAYGAKADPLRPHIVVEAGAMFDASLSDDDVLAAEPRGAWDALLGSLVGPEQLAGRDR